MTKILKRWCRKNWALDALMCILHLVEQSAVVPGGKFSEVITVLRRERNHPLPLHHSWIVRNTLKIIFLNSQTGRWSGFAGAEQGIWSRAADRHEQEVQMSQTPMNYFFFWIVFCGIVRTPGPEVQCFFYRSLTQQENDGHCGQDKCGHLCVPSGELFGPHIAKTPSHDQKIKAAALQCGWCRNVSLAHIPSRAQMWTQPLLFFFDFSTVFHSYSRLPYLCLLAQAQGKSVPKFPLASQAVYHCKQFCTLLLLMALQSQPCSLPQMEGQSQEVSLHMS